MRGSTSEAVVIPSVIFLEGKIPGVHYVISYHDVTSKKGNTTGGRNFSLRSSLN